MKTIKKLLKEYKKENGIEMKLYVDLMIANRGKKDIVNKKLDELEEFFSKMREEVYFEIEDKLSERYEEDLDQQHEGKGIDGASAYAEAIAILKKYLLK